MMINRIYNWLPWISFGVGLFYAETGNTKMFLYYALLAILIKIK